MSDRTSWQAVIGRCLGLIVVVGCADSATAPVTFGPQIALESLQAVDGHALPCCAVDSGGARVMIVGGALSFFRSTTYSDTVATPGGLMSRACVREIPNGAHLDQTGLVTLPDGSTYLTLPCAVGTYRLTVSQRLVYGDGTERTIQRTLSTGTYTWRRGSLTLLEWHRRRPSVASMSGASVTTVAQDHEYQFVAVRSP